MMIDEEVLNRITQDLIGCDILDTEFATDFAHEHTLKRKEELKTALRAYVESYLLWKALKEKTLPEKE